MKAYLIFDGRAHAGNPDDAIVYEHAGYDKDEAIKSLSKWPDGVLYEFDYDADSRVISGAGVFVKAGSVYDSNAEEDV